MNFLDNFDDVRSCGANTSRWMARCKAHDDTHHSLSIGRNGDRWLLHCQAGCWIGQVLACHGLDWNDLFDDDAPGNGNGNGRISLSKVAMKSRPKLDMSGDAMMPPKHIVEYWAEQLSPPLRKRLHELKGWSDGTLHSLAIGWDGVRVTIPVFGILSVPVVSLIRYLPTSEPKALAIGTRSLYPDPRAFDPGDNLWLVEGEPDAISMVELGESAVAIPGVSKFNEEWPLRFKDRRVTVCLDCDEQGREAARKWASALSSAGVENRVVDLDPNRADGFDIGDALAVASRQGRVRDLKAYLAKLHAEAWSA